MTFAAISIHFFSFSTPKTQPFLRVFDAGAVETATGRCYRGLRQYDALSFDAHQSSPLRRLYRLSGKSSRDFPFGPRRPYAIRPVDRKYESGLQGQEKAHVPRQREVRLGTVKQTAAQIVSHHIRQ